ncbi:MAG: 50S ribosomal protein L23 [Patescibacteria group bacterium]|nr:50S ribosomal protein L23 [Patescibacteria group bacterium]
MGIFSRLKGNKDKVKEADKAQNEAAVETVNEAEGLVLQPQKTAHKRLDVIPVLPRISEKAAVLSSSGKYVFNVPMDANKAEVKKSVESLYGVKVTDVNMLRGIGKIVRRGRVEGRRNRWKKAVVTLKVGDKIDLFVGV